MKKFHIGKWNKGYFCFLLLCIFLLLAGCGSGEYTDNNFDNANKIVEQLTEEAAEQTVDEASKNDDKTHSEKGQKSNKKLKDKKNNKSEQDSDRTLDTSEDKVKKTSDTSEAFSEKANKKKTKKVLKSSADLEYNKDDNADTNPYIVNSDGKDKGKDKYNTEPIPEGEQLPVEPADVTVDTNEAATCSLIVECKTVLNNSKQLKKGKESIIPPDGIIYQNSEAVFYEGESVYDVLCRELKEHSIHYEFTFTPGYNSDYIEGIGNLYERDCGSLSGWKYFVNSWSPNYGCSRYIVKRGDKIEWRYTCDLGKDLS